MCTAVVLNALLTQGMSVGTNNALAEGLCHDCPLSEVLGELEASFTAAIQSYQIRAAQCGQSFKHMVLLEAAVQGWCVPNTLLPVSSFAEAYMYMQTHMPMLSHDAQDACYW